MSDSTHVDTDALLTFGGRLTRYLHGDGQGYGTATAQATADVAVPNLGVSGMREITYAGSSYAAAAEAAGQFLRDTCNGLLALSYVAGQVAETYASGDAEQADQMAAVTEAFIPPPGVASIASSNAEEAVRQAADAAVALLAGLLGGAAPLPYGEPAPSGPRPTGGSTVDHGPDDPQEPANQRYDRYVSQVAAHDAFVAGGGRGGSAEDGYDPRAEHDAAVEEAARRSERDHIPYEVVVDEHGMSDVVQSDPDDVPYVDPVDYTERAGSATYPVSSPGGD